MNGGQQQQTGIPDIPVPLPDFVKQIAETAGTRSAEVVIEKHAKTCVFKETVEKIDARVTSLEECKNNIRGFFGFVRRNWQVILVVLLLAINWYKSGQVPDQKTIDESVQKVKQVSGALGKFDSESVSTAPKDPVQNKTDNSIVN